MVRGSVNHHTENAKTALDERKLLPRRPAMHSSSLIVVGIDTMASEFIYVPHETRQHQEEEEEERNQIKFDV